jgi:hypothetical protein
MHTACQIPGCLYIRREQLTPANEAGNKKEQLEKGLEEEEEKMHLNICALRSHLKELFLEKSLFVVSDVFPAIIPNVGSYARALTVLPEPLEAVPVGVVELAVSAEPGIDMMY